MSRVQSGAGPDLAWRICVRRDRVLQPTAATLGKFPFHTVEQRGKLKTDRSAELHISFARRYRLTVAHSQSSALGAPGEAGTHGRAPKHEASAGQGKAKPPPPWPAHSPRPHEAGSSSAQERQAGSRQKKDFSSHTAKRQREGRLAGAGPDGCGVVPRHTARPRSQGSLEGHGERSGWDGGGPASPASSPPTRSSASAAVPGRANPARRHGAQGRATAREKRHR